jgi:hypothetical protein
MLRSNRKEPDVKEFETAVAAVETEDNGPTPYPFIIVEKNDEGEEVDRVECTAYEPGEGALIVLMADTMGRGHPGEKLAGIINFLADALDEESKQYVVSRLLDRNDPFGLDEITPIVWWLVEEWGGRPTKQPSDYARSRKPGGPRSTPRTTKQKSSASRSTVS